MTFPQSAVNQEIPVSIQCCKCGRSNFRPSRIHRFDFKRLAVLELPVRCRICRRRGFASLLSALKLALEAKSTLTWCRLAERAEEGVPERCLRCGRKSLRLSRIRNRDIKQLLRLRYPVRCKACLDRGYTLIWNAVMMIANGKAPRRVRTTPSLARSAGRYV